MDLPTIIEALQSSPLAALLPGLESARAQPAPDGAGKNYVILPVRQLFAISGQKIDSLLIRETDFHYHFLIQVFVTDRSNYAAERALAVNQELLVGRAGYNLKGGEFVVDWALGRRPGAECSLGEIEYVIASLLLHYYGEKLNFVVDDYRRTTELVQAALHGTVVGAMTTLQTEIVPMLMAVRNRQ